MEAALNTALFDAARERAGLSITKLAQAADLNPGTVSRLREGKIKSPSLAMARKVAAALHVGVDDLFPRETPRPSGPDGPRLVTASEAGRKGASARWRNVPRGERSKQMAAISRARWDLESQPSVSGRWVAALAALLGPSDGANDGASYREAA